MRNYWTTINIIIISCTFSLILLLGNLVVSRKQRHLQNVSAISIPSQLCLFHPWNALKLKEYIKKA